MVNLKQLMFDKDITQKQLADILGVSQPSVSKIIRGERSLQKYQYDALIQEFGEGIIGEYSIPLPSVTFLSAEEGAKAEEILKAETKEIATSIGKSLEMLTESHKQLLDAHDILIAEMVKQNERMGKLVDKLIE